MSQGKQLNQGAWEGVVTCNCNIIIWLNRELTKRESKNLKYILA